MPSAKRATLSATVFGSFMAGVCFSLLFLPLYETSRPCPKPEPAKAPPPQFIRSPCPDCAKCDDATGSNSSCESDDTQLVMKLDTETTAGVSTYSEAALRTELTHPLLHGVYGDLLAYTAMNQTELFARLRRLRQHHFVVEHRFINPRSAREATEFYRHSVGYLWGNSLHRAMNLNVYPLTPADGPVLEYCGGVGNTCLALAKRGIKCIYFGIGIPEFEFAQFRAKRHGLEHMITFVKPYVDNGDGLEFDPIRSLQLGTTVPEQVGAVFALDVFEHIPDYQHTAAHLVSLIRDGGMLFEATAFDGASTSDTDIHLRGKVSLTTALRGMVRKGAVGNSNMWVKQNVTAVQR